MVTPSGDLREILDEPGAPCPGGREVAMTTVVE
jgi:hypothetical protein